MKKRLTALCLLFTLLLTALPVSCVSAAADAVTVRLAAASYVYSGKTVTPGITVKNAAGKTLKNGTDYAVSYASGRQNVGAYKVTVTLKGTYTGKIAKTFRILPKTTALKKLTGAANAVTVQWNKQATQTSGYQLQCATSGKFTKPKTLTVSSAKTVSKTVTKLTFNTQYHLRIRTYKTVSGKKYYSAWSAGKTVTTLPTYSGKPYVAVNGNLPTFTAKQKGVKKAYETYASLDSKNRCGPCVACVCKDTMPTGSRGEIGSVKPSGWHTVKYDCVEGKYLYNRCHLIGYQLTAENANKRNLITGTRYLNVTGMLPFENMVADYIKETGHHVIYRVTPIFVGKELVARGVRMEGWSVEDKGDGICFDVYCFNNQPGVSIDYATGDSHLSGKTPEQKPAVSSKGSYVLNTSSKKFHLPTCSSVKLMSESNKQTVSCSRKDLIAAGYDPCKNCNP